MALKPEEFLLSLDERLRDSKRQATSMAPPVAVHHRLDLMAQAAADVYATRAEIVGTLIALSDMDQADLERAVLAYRKSTVADVLPELATPEGSNVISIARRGPGRPGRAVGNAPD